MSQLSHATQASIPVDENVYWKGELIATVPGFNFNKIVRVEKFSRRYEESIKLEDCVDWRTNKFLGRHEKNKRRSYYMRSRWVNVHGHDDDAIMPLALKSYYDNVEYESDDCEWSSDDKEGVLVLSLIHI